MTVSVLTGWAVLTLGEIGKWGSGGTPSRSNSSFYIGSIPWFKTGELGPQVIYKSEENISEEAIKASSAKIFPAGSIALAMYGATIGKISILGIDAATNQACAVVVEDSQVINKNYLFYYLKSQKDAFINAGQGGAQPNISQTVIKAWLLPLAPLQEQRRIADKLDTVLTRVDALNDRLTQITPLLKRFRQSILAAATSGRLTEDWRDLEGVSDTWIKTTLGEIANVQGGVTKDSKKQFELDEELPYLRVANVQRGYLDLSEIKKIRVPTGKIESLLLDVGDVLFNEGGDLDKLGRGWVWNGEIERCTFQNHVFRARLFNKENKSKYISWWGNYRGLNYFIGAGKQTTNLASINKTILCALPIDLPTPEEQTEIVRRVEILFAYADRLEARLQTALTAAERLTPALLAKAFRGELVPQDPNDEPATELLRRLREARAADAPAKKTRGRKAVV